MYRSSSKKFTRIARFGGLIAVAAVLGLAMNNCDDVRLSRIPQSAVLLSKSVPELCALPPSVQQNNTKILFLVDMSGSNQFGNFGSGSGTDPGKQFRYGLIKDFVDKHVGNDQIYYSFIVFQGSSATSYINDGSDQSPVFSNDPTQINGALAKFLAAADNDQTPYKAAFTLAMAALSKDRLLTAQQPNQDVQNLYNIVLLSDGVPTDYFTDATQTVIDDNAINADVLRMIGTQGDSTLSTVYYGPNQTADDLGAAARLKRMAVIGKGYFSNYLIDGKIPLETLIAFKDGDPWVIKNFFVTNLTTAPCDDGTMGTDSDADGICDKDEMRYNSVLKADTTLATRMAGMAFNPTKRNSFGNVYNDYINYRRIIYGENLDLACVSTKDTDGDLLNDCEEAYLKAGTPAGPTANWTSHMGSSGDPQNFDSDGDGFTDYIELIFGRSRSASLDFNSLKVQIEGYLMSEILAQHRNPMHPSASPGYQVDFHYSRVNEQGQNCYSYDQPDLPLVNTLALADADAPGAPQLTHKSGENVILIYTIQARESDPNGAGRFFTNYQKIPYGSQGASVDIGEMNFTSFTPINARVNQPAAN